MKKKRRQQKNIITIGDIVLFSEKSLLIEEIQTRTSFFIKESKKKQQLIAANIDLVLITVSLSYPKINTSLVDRYLISAEKGLIPAMILINKIDLLTEEGKQTIKTLKNIYKKIKVPIILLSAKKKTGLKALKSLIKNKTTAFVGQSGVGKTSLINTLAKTQFKTGALTKKTNKGAHITTSSRLLPIAPNSYCIDTPGIKSFGIWCLTRQDIMNHFQDIQKEAQKCKYSNCTHISEPGCYVKNNKKINSIRFKSYLKLMQDLR